MTAGWWFSTGSIELALRFWRWAVDALLTLYRRPKLWIAAVMLVGVMLAILPRNAASLSHDAAGLSRQEHTVPGGAGSTACALGTGFGFHLEAAHIVSKADGHPSPDPRCIAGSAIALGVTVLASATTRGSRFHRLGMHTGLWARGPPSVM